MDCVPQVAASLDDRGQRRTGVPALGADGQAWCNQGGSMSRSCECPKCGADISDSWQPAEWDVGINAGWFCDPCNLSVGDDGSYEPMEGDVAIGPAPPRADGKIGTP